MQTTKPTTILITASGPDRPGITSELTGVLAESEVTILDIGQAVIHGLLSLSILFKLGPEEFVEKAVIKDLLFKAAELGLKMDFQVIEESKQIGQPHNRKDFRYVVTLMGEPLTARVLHEVSNVLVKSGINIDVINRLSNDEFSCVEMQVSSMKEAPRLKLKEELLQIATEQGADIALQAEGLFRRSKRLVVMDMDSTLIENEVIDELAREMGMFDEVAAITRRAMTGKMNYDEALKQRVAMLEGLKTEQIEKVVERLRLTPGAEELIQTLKRLGYKIGLISGGFTCIADRYKEKLGIDYVYANRLEIENGRLTGKVIPPIVNAQRKADLLEVIAQNERISLDQVIAIGDGANDLLMLGKAGLGIAFNAKQAVREKADHSLNRRNLRSILYLLGISARDLEVPSQKY